MDADKVALTLPDGRLVLDNGEVVTPRTIQQPAAAMAREIKNGRAAAETLERVHRKLGDLPEQTEKMNAIAAVLMYTGVGLSDTDIAVALKTSEDNIAKLKDLDSYKQLAEMFDSTVFEDAKRTANHIVSRASADAAHRIVQAVADPDPSIAVAASRDVLRIAGVGADRADPSKVSSLNIKITRSGDRHSEDEVTVEINNA